MNTKKRPLHIYDEVAMLANINTAHLYRKPNTYKMWECNLIEEENSHHDEYEKYRVIVDTNHISDFDKEIRRITEKE